MKLHSDIIDLTGVYDAMLTAKRAGLVSADIAFVVLHKSPSRSRHNGFEIQLGTNDKTTGPSRSRKFKNSGHSGADNIYAATWDEWGFFIAELFAIDPDATFGSYKGLTDFNVQTGNKFVPVKWSHSYSRNSSENLS